MTIGKQLSIHMKDIKTVDLSCHHCKAVLSLPPNDFKRGPPEKCPNCGVDWFDFDTVEKKQLMYLILAIKAFTERADSKVCQVQLTVSQPD